LHERKTLKAFIHLGKRNLEERSTRPKRGEKTEETKIQKLKSKEMKGKKLKIK